MHKDFMWCNYYTTKARYTSLGVNVLTSEKYGKLPKLCLFYQIQQNMSISYVI